ncbi:hypothetical protein CVT25_014107 [Psilocybe cyanescens]|uniref:C2H2-type domain-containing protein n=1 Tax=Psilocybe cyanescens TaxID=93625 RepID=A0A409XG29_PSICY|nr:hypothetical protein CVT25_014107 [Psilocybe cyanescens]
MKQTQTTVLGKRKATAHSDTFVLLLSPTPSSSAPLPEEPDTDSSYNQASGSNGNLIIVNGNLIPQTKKCYRCTYQGCEKAYSKPSRLEEHERSHTGQCTENDCLEAFSKHHLLRAHICSEHAPPGTKPYRCSHEGCTKSFDTNQHLRTHQKTHDDKRYTCVHPNCLATDDHAPIYFPTWSALQSHIRTNHPPTCLHPSCNGRTFSNQVNLRNHLKLHEQREIDIDIGNDIESDNESDGPARKKRRGGEHGREWICEFSDCGKDFKSKKSMTTHMNVTHLGQRNFICQYADCKRSFGYKHLLQRHLAKLHTSESTGADATNDESSEAEDQNQEPAFDIDAITGQTYAQSAEVRLREAKALRCPFPFLRDLTGDDSDPTVMDVLTRGCDYVFNRGYDLRRHLDASHDTVVSKETVDAWVRRQKKISPRH